MMNVKSQRFIFLLSLCFLFLPIVRVQLFSFPVPSAFGKEEGKKQEVKPEARVESPLTLDKSKIDFQSLPYSELAGKNIFSPERKEFSTSLSEARKPLVRPQVVLYGVTITGDFKFATLVQSGRPLRKGEREMLTLKVGESIGEYKLTKVLPDRITLEAEGDSFEILLYDPARPKERVAVKTENPSVTITSALPGSTTPSSTPATPSGVQRTIPPEQEGVVLQKTTISGTPPPVTPSPSSPAPPTSTPYPYFQRRRERIIPSLPVTPTPPQVPQSQPGRP